MQYRQITRLLLSTIPRPWGNGVSKKLQEIWKLKYFTVLTSLNSLQYMEGKWRPAKEEKKKLSQGHAVSVWQCSLLSRKQSRGAAHTLSPPRHDSVSTAGFGPVSGRPLDRDFGPGEAGKGCPWEKLRILQGDPAQAPFQETSQRKSSPRGQEHGSGRLPEENP